MACAHTLSWTFLCCQCTVAGDRRRAVVSQHGVLPVIHVNSSGCREIMVKLFVHVMKPCGGVEV